MLAAYAGISIVYLSEIERGIKAPRLSLFISLADILNVSTDALLRDKLDCGKAYAYNEITQKLDGLTPKQRAATVEMLDAIIKNIDLF